MTKEFIKYEQAVALKELGFDEECLGLYRNGSLELKKNTGGYYDNKWINHFNEPKICTAPLYQQAFSFFREKHKLHSTITSISQESWQWHITKPGESLGKLYNEDFYTYEEAEQECLDKLIEICKNK